MERRKLCDSDIEALISLWYGEPSLWNNTLPVYSNVDERKAALRRMSQQLNLDRNVGAYCIVIVGFLPRDACSAQRIAVVFVCPSVLALLQV